MVVLPPRARAVRPLWVCWPDVQSAARARTWRWRRRRCRWPAKWSSFCRASFRTSDTKARASRTACGCSNWPRRTNRGFSIASTDTACFWTWLAPAATLRGRRAPAAAVRKRRRRADDQLGLRPPGRRGRPTRRVRTAGGRSPGPLPAAARIAGQDSSTAHWPRTWPRSRRPRSANGFGGADPGGTWRRRPSPRRSSAATELIPERGVEERPQAVAAAGVAQFAQRLGFDLPDAFARDGEVLARLLRACARCRPAARSAS